MNLVGIVPLPVIKAGKSAPDPLLLADDCLGYNAKICIVFKNSPGGIHAEVASGATVIAVCGHDLSQAVIISRVAEALRLMTNLKHLSFADSHTYYPGQPHSQAGAELLRQGCNFQLHSLEWQHRDNLSFLLTHFIPSQNALRAFHLTSAYGDFSNVPQALRDASARVCSSLQSFSRPRLLSEVILLGKRVQYLRWTRLTIEALLDIGDIRRVARELEHVKLLDFQCEYAPPLSSFVGYLISLELLIMMIPRTEQELITISSLRMV